MAKLIDEGIFMLDGGGAYCATKALYSDARAFCEAVAMKGDEDFGEPNEYDDIDYLVAHTKISYAHHCVGPLPWSAEASCYWQIEDEPGRGRSPVWHLDLN